MKTYRKKINELHRGSVSPPSDLQRQFAPAFNSLISQDPLEFSGQHNQHGYVKNDGIESKLYDWLDSTSNLLCLFVGETGIGKSTYIRKVFGTDKNARIIKKTLVIPFFLNGNDINSSNFKDHFVKKLSSACKICLENEKTTLKADDFYDYIKTTNPHLLEVGFFFDECTKEQTIRSFRTQNEYGFFAELLKYSIEQNPNIDRVIVLYDDLESIVSTETLFRFVKQTCSFHTCFQNTRDRSPPLTSVLAIRPATLRSLERTDWFHAYTPDDREYVEQPAHLADVFLAKVAAKTQAEIGGKYKNTERILEAINELGVIVQKLPRDFLGILLDLSNHNLREALRLLARTLSNRTHIQTPHNLLDPHFKIDSADFEGASKLANLTKALTYGEKTIYVDHNANLFNIIRNTANRSTDLIVPYLCKYLYFRNSRDYRSMEFIRQDELLYEMNKLFGQQEFIDSSLQYLINERAIERVLLNERGQASAHYIIARPRLFGVFKLLLDSSVYLEAMRDDTFATEEVLLEQCDKTHYRPTAELPPEEKDKAICRLLASIFESEKLLLNGVPTAERGRVRRHFGDILFSRMLFEGINASRSRTSAPENEVFNALRNAISTFESRYNHV